MLAGIKEKASSEIPYDRLVEANEYLARNIVAALSLGDISLISSEIEWIKNLIVHHNYDGDLLSLYLTAYYEAAQFHLDEQGSPTVEWLAFVSEGMR